MDGQDNMAYNVLAFIPQAARDCEIRAKDVMGNVKESLQLRDPKLRLSGKIIAMGTSHYRRIGHPCNGFHELFFNGLMFVLQGIVGVDIAELERNSEMFVTGLYQANVRGARYALDEVSIDHMAGDEMCRLRFSDGNNPLVMNNEQVGDDEDMNE